MADKSVLVAAARMSSQEIVFWISLFGLDMGVTLMLPERLRVEIGVVLSLVSFTGLLWSLGYPVSEDVSWKTALLFIGIGAIGAFLVALNQRRDWPLEFNDMADQLEAYVERVQYHYRKSQIPAFDSQEGREILDRYLSRCGLEAASLASSMRRAKIAKLLKSPSNLQDISHCAELLNSVADLLRQQRPWLEVIVATTGGGLLGGGLFGVVYLAVRTFRG
ncbi:MAG: hypothetical protein ACREQT_13410 [Candidatus Binataceae bacterium]